jgi:hypothetical protein
MLRWIKENWFRLGIVAALLIFVGGYTEYLEEKNRIAEQERMEAKLTAEDTRKREYVANQKKDCRAIYETEGKKWSNVQGWYYNETDDMCEITYQEQTPKSKKECDANFVLAEQAPAYESSFDFRHSAILEKLRCYDGLFIKSF